MKIETPLVPFQQDVWENWLNRLHHHLNWVRNVTPQSFEPVGPHQSIAAATLQAIGVHIPRPNHATWDQGTKLSVDISNQVQQTLHLLSDLHDVLDLTSSDRAAAAKVLEGLRTTHRPLPGPPGTTTLVSTDSNDDVPMMDRLYWSQLGADLARLSAIDACLAATGSGDATMQAALEFTSSDGFLHVTAHIGRAGRLQRTYGLIEEVTQHTSRLVSAHVNALADTTHGSYILSRVEETTQDEDWWFTRHELFNMVLDMAWETCTTHSQSLNMLLTPDARWSAWTSGTPNTGTGVWALVSELDRVRRNLQDAEVAR